MPLEIIFHMLEKVTGAITSGIDESSTTTDSFDPIAAITDPLQEYILKVDKTGLGDTNYTGSFVKVLYYAIFFTLIIPKHFYSNIFYAIFLINFFAPIF